MARCSQRCERGRAASTCEPRRSSGPGRRAGGGANLGAAGAPSRLDRLAAQSDLGEARSIVGVACCGYHGPRVDQLTIILPTYDRRHVLEHTLPVYLALARRHRLLVIDDGSRDGTAAWLRSLGVEVIARRHRRGLPAARNLGIALARTPWVLFGEDDVLMPPDLPERLLAEAARLARRAPLGAVAGQLYAGSGWRLPA